MKYFTPLIAVFVLTSGLVACDQLPGQGSAVGVLDLSAVASATGQDEVIRAKAEEGRNELMSQLQQLAGELDQQIATERESLGETPAEEASQRILQLTAQARQQIAQAQQEAQQQATQMETSLVLEFRDELMPLAQSIANDRGIKIILSADAYVFWNDTAIDITQAVIDSWNLSADARAASNSAEVPVTGAAMPAAAAEPATSSAPEAPVEPDAASE